MYPIVLQLTVHLPGMHMVAYNKRDDLRNVINREQSQKSMLIEYFWMNSVGHLCIVSCIGNFHNIIDGIDWRKNGFQESKEHRLAGWYMCTLQKEKGITCTSFSTMSEELLLLMTLKLQVLH
jgi:tRNA 2-selenouridine synthase SelU